MGRVSVEKNLPAFFELDVPGTKVVVGDGPALEKYKKQYSDVLFVGAKEGEELAKYYASSDVFVFPSKTDTFGIVMLEAMASGLPVAAHPVTGPIDVIEDFENGYLSNNLKLAVETCFNLDRNKIHNSSHRFDWDDVANTFIKHLAQIKTQE